MAELWECPRCGARLTGRNMSHACGDHTVARFLDGRGPVALDLWQHLLTVVGRCGPFTFAPAKTRVALMVRVRFLAVTALSDRGMTFHIWLRQPVEAPRIFRVDELGPNTVIHWIRVRARDEIDAVSDLLCASYRVGCGLR